jgi:hypothetical protein
MASEFLRYFPQPITKLAAPHLPFIAMTICPWRGEIANQCS